MRRTLPVLAIALLLLGHAPAWAVPPEAIPLAVRDGCCEFVLSGEASDQYILVLGALSRAPGPHSVTVRAQGTDAAPLLPRDQATLDPVWRKKVTELRERQDRERKARLAEEFPPSPQPPKQRTFWLFTGAHDFQKAESYSAVTGILQAVGRHCQVYVDRDHPDPAALQPTIDDIVRTFDDKIVPVSRQYLGRALDVDRDGRFTILLTPWLGKLCEGKVALGGFVRAADFDRDQLPPFSNRCDMMYLNTDLKPGPHLRTLLAHEHAHAIIHGERAGQNEESWLDEGLAHLAEELHGHAWSNLDYRVSTYLNAPERYPLVVPDASSAGRWRCAGHRGAAFLFLRSCARRHGHDLLGRLICTRLTGLSNLEAAAGEPFADLFRSWCVQTASDSFTASEPALPFGSRLNKASVSRLLCGPRVVEVPLAEGVAKVEIAGTAAAYFLLHSPAGNCRVQIAAEPDAALQATLVPLPRGAARLSLAAAREGGGVRLHLTAHGAAVTLDGAAWERLVPSKSRVEDTNYRSQEDGRAAAESWFGELELAAGESRTSPPLAFPADETEWVFKVSGVDATGRRITVWAAIP